MIILKKTNMNLEIRISLFLLVCCLSSTLAQTNITCENKAICDECVANTSCMWCTSKQSCMTYPFQTILPPTSVCPLNDARWGRCNINFQILIITLSVLTAVIIIAFFVCLFHYCKCENCGNSIKESKMQRKTDKRTAAQEQRRTEMMARHDEIRQKYGLSRGSAYAKFDNSA